MSFQTEHRGFAVGQEVGSCGRCTRLVLGLLLLVSIGRSVAQMGPSATLLGQIGGSLLLTAVLYIVLFWVLGVRVLSHLHPWILTGIFWAPMLFIPLLLLISWGWGFGMLLYLSVALIARGADVLRWLRVGGVAQPPLPATLHRLLPAQCHRPGRAPLHETVNGSEDQGCTASRACCRPCARKTEARHFCMQQTRLDMPTRRSSRDEHEARLVSLFQKSISLRIPWA